MIGQENWRMYLYASWKIIAQGGIVDIFIIFMIIFIIIIIIWQCSVHIIK